MTYNRDTEATWRYHNLTKHSYQSIRADRHYLDWSNQPSPFKIYPDIEPMPLPRTLVQTMAPALSVITATEHETDDAKEIDLARLSSVLYYSAGVTKHKTYAGGELYFRAAACAGALYPVETYVVCGEIEGMAAGVYHFSPGDFALRKLRDGDLRGVLARATSDEAHVVAAPVTLIYTAMSWRSTWKYRDRAYRYHFWDNGMIAANALALAAAHELPAAVVMGFVESDVNKLLGIDGEQELVLSLLPLGSSHDPLPDCPTIEALPDISFEVIPLSTSPVDYPSIREMHRASSLTGSDEVREWRATTLGSTSSEIIGEEFSLAPPSDTDLPGESIEDVIQRRASTRRFAHKNLRFADLSAIIDRATRGIPADFSRADRNPLNELYIIVNRVEGLPPGAYFYRRENRSLELLKPGDFSKEAAYLTLGQDLGGDASATFFFMADLKVLLEAYGNRGYRAAQMEAGIIGGKMYVASYALKRGATGLTFFDDDVTKFFSPHAANKDCMLVVSIGVPGKRVIV
ncbi:MAG TPA: SagB/ThcOx family dehydrogenase [Blastocatellia bacterium]|nr:SagB/ThcOx family dehydrogenase [Blastocatellia bacterium]